MKELDLTRAGILHLLNGHQNARYLHRLLEFLQDPYTRSEVQGNERYRVVDFLMSCGSKLNLSSLGTERGSLLFSLQNRDEALTT